MNIRLKKEKLLVETEQEKVSKGGIFIPDVGLEKPSVGKVILTGELKDKELKVGDKILFGKYDGVEVELEMKKYLLISEQSVLAVFI